MLRCVVANKSRSQCREDIIRRLYFAQVDKVYLESR